MNDIVFFDGKKMGSTKYFMNFFKIKNESGITARMQ